MRTPNDPSSANVMFGPDLARVYDLVYRGRGKDYPAEAAALARLVRARKPEAASVLDVACGTGEHLASLHKLFDRAEGLELSPHMLAVARPKLPHMTIHAGDMCSFRLGRTFDVVTCLFGSVGYLQSAEALVAAVDCMGRHLTPGGVLIVEPWWFPDMFVDGYVAGDVVCDDGLTVGRVSHTRGEGRAARIEAHYVVADPAGIRHFVDTSVYQLFTQAEYLAAFDHAGCTVEYLTEYPEEAWSGPGLFVGVRRQGVESIAKDPTT